MNDPINAQTTDTPKNENEESHFKPFRVFGFVGLLFFGISLWALWYTDEVSFPRYCHMIDETIENLEKVIVEQEPAGDGARRPYLIAAKLIFILPRQPHESVNDYLSRVRITLKQRCAATS